jgi:prophage regulatory protein
MKLKTTMKPVGGAPIAMGPAQPAASNNGEIICGWRELVAIVRRSRAQLWRDVRNGRFPQPIELGPNSVGWYSGEIEHWLLSRRRRTYGRPGNVEFGEEVEPVRVADENAAKKTHGTGNASTPPGPTRSQPCRTQIRALDRSQQNPKFLPRRRRGFRAIPIDGVDSADDPGAPRGHE